MWFNMSALENRSAVGGGSKAPGFSHGDGYISYPNRADIAAARARGVKAGGDIAIHGLRRGLGFLRTWHRAFGDWTHGCIAVTNTEMDEIWRAVRDGTPIVIRH